jgi:NAD dependent epimerase/dehydratase family enzyme
MIKDAFAKADYIIHLAGASVAEKRWNDKRKQEIVSSRVDSGKLIVGSLKTIPNKVKTVISASGIGWYGPDKMMQWNSKKIILHQMIFWDKPAKNGKQQ